jgi:hypothetical protein
MKTKTLTGALALVATVVLISNSCTKTIVNDIYDCECVDSCDTTPPPPKPPVCAETSSWFGVYSGGTPQGGITSHTTVGDSTFISNGIGKLANSPYGYYFTGIRLNIPGCRNLSGDSIRFDARVRNPIAEGAIEQLDVALSIIGEQDSAWVNYIGRSAQQQFTQLGLGSGYNSNMPELIQLFQDWTEVSLEVKNNVLSTYKNGTLIKSFTIPSGKKLGKIKQIRLHFKGTGSVDWVKLYDNAGTLKLKEEFNNGTRSNVEWF